MREYQYDFWRPILEEAVNGATLKAVSRKYDVPVSRIRAVLFDVLEKRVPELFSVVAADGVITAKELADHRPYILSMLALPSA